MTKHIITFKYVLPCLLCAVNNPIVGQLVYKFYSYLVNSFN